VVPDIDYLHTKIIREVHGRITTAHPGRGKTRKLVTSLYWWPGIIGDIDVYVANCLECRPAKSPRDKTPGLLHPIPPPLQSWRRVVMDFNIQPKDKYGYDNALVMMCPLSKTGWTVPCKKSATARDAAQMWYWGPYRIVGLPEEIITDRGSVFLADFTDELSKILGVKWKPSSAGHHETAGQIENLNMWIN
jgi:hypothetical protein